MVDLQSGIPLPRRTRTHAQASYRYPFATMEVDESFVYEFTVRAGHKIVSRWNTRYGGERVFTSRVSEMDGGRLRIWRVK